MAKHWARQELKRNEIAVILNKGLSFYKQNREALIAGTGIGALLIVVIVYFIIQYMSLNTRAWDALAQAQSIARGGQLEQAEQQLQKVVSNFKRTPAAIHSLLFLAEIYFNTRDYQKASETYRQIISTHRNKMLAPFAYVGLGSSLQDAGDLKGAIDTYQTFTAQYADHFLYPSIIQSLAYCFEKTGQISEARSQYEKMITMFPQSIWSENAYVWLQILDGKNPANNEKEIK